MTRFAPVPAAALEAISSVAGRRRLPSTRPTRPPASATAKHHRIKAGYAKGKAEVRAVIERATERRKAGRATVFFLDEIHRFNKAQQDALLHAVEDGVLVLIGATTENPYFEVNSALLSRAQVYELHTLEAAD